jgi:hypothetical protein
MAKKVTVAASAQVFDGQVFAVVVGIENYQEEEKGKPVLPKVDFARQDAEGFAQALKSIYPEDKADISLLIDPKRRDGLAFASVQHRGQHARAAREGERSGGRKRLQTRARLRSCSELIDVARQYRFTLDGPSRLLPALA